MKLSAKAADKKAAGPSATDWGEMLALNLAGIFPITYQLRDCYTYTAEFCRLGPFPEVPSHIIFESK